MRGGFLFVQGEDRSAEEDAGLGEIWGDDGGEGEEALADGIERGFLKEGGSGRGDHDRVDDDGDVAIPQEFTDGDDVCFRKEHSGFERSDGIASEQEANLLLEDKRRDGMDFTNDLWCLGDDTGDGTESMNSTSRKCFKVSLDSCTARRVRTGDGESGRKGHVEILTDH